MLAMREVWPFLPEVHLFYSKRKCERFIRKRLKKEARFIDTDAQTWYVDGVAVILMSLVSEPTLDYSLLAHEAYHVVSAHYERLGEDYPSDEFVAYGIQMICMSLFNAHKERMTSSQSGIMPAKSYGDDDE